MTNVKKLNEKTHGLIYVQSNERKHDIQQQRQPLNYVIEIITPC